MNPNDNPITMVPVPNCDGATRFIPSDRAELKIDTVWLNERGACESGRSWFSQNFPEGCSYIELRSKLKDDNLKNWETWMLDAAGGDTATAGYRGTATAGYRGTATAGDRGTATAGDSGTATAGYSGTATAGYRGTATAGDSGTATAGYSGTATAGDRGTATAGDRGTATAGDSGTATAGENGVISILEWDAKRERYRVIIGYIGEDGLEPNVPYVVVDSKLTRKDPEQA